MEQNMGMDMEEIARQEGQSGTDENKNVGSDEATIQNNSRPTHLEVPDPSKQPKPEYRMAVPIAPEQKPMTDANGNVLSADFSHYDRTPAEEQPKVTEIGYVGVPPKEDVVRKPGFWKRLFGSK